VLHTICLSIGPIPRGSATAGSLAEVGGSFIANLCEAVGCDDVP
jgi:hypothetical protein